MSLTDKDAADLAALFAADQQAGLPNFPTNLTNETLDVMVFEAATGEQITAAPYLAESSTTTFELSIDGLRTRLTARQAYELGAALQDGATWALMQDVSVGLSDKHIDEALGGSAYELRRRAELGL